MNGHSHTERIGFIGLGNMGAPMSAHIAKAGFPLTVFDVDAARCTTHAASIAARAAHTLAELGAACDIVICMLPTGAIVREVLLTMQGGLASHLPAGALIIDMSSSEPAGTRRLGAELAQRGLTLMDAPVSGAVPRATDATLTLMVGADDSAALPRARPVLQSMGKRIFETGRLGSGHAMKALNNYVAAAGFAAASEALILADGFGLDRSTALDILNESTGCNFSTQSTLKSQVLTEAWASGFGLALLSKDVKIAADLASDLDCKLPLVAHTSAWWQQACGALGGARDGGPDHTEAYRFWAGLAGKHPA